MPRIIKYKINYEQKGGMDLQFLPNYLAEIKQIYELVDGNNKNQVVLTGSGAILYYLHLLNRNDLIETYKAPSDVDLLLMNIEKIRNFSLAGLSFSNFTKQSGDNNSNTYMMQNKQNKTLVSFDLTKLNGQNIRHNVVDGIKIIDLDILESFYSDPDELSLRPAEKQAADMEKIRIIRLIKDTVKERFQHVAPAASSSSLFGDSSASARAAARPAFDSPFAPASARAAASSFNSPLASGLAASAFDSPRASGLAASAFDSPDARPQSKFAKKLF